MARHSLLVALSLAALALGGFSASAAPAGAGKAQYWLVVASDRDGEARGYSVRADGSRLSPLLPLTKSLVPDDVSRDAGTIEYHDARVERGFVSRANGTHLHRIAHPGLLSSDGKLVAFERTYQKNKQKNGLWVAGSNGRGIQRLPSEQDDELLAWSPDATSVALLRVLGNGRFGIVVQPLHGQGRLLVRGLGLSSVRWSPDGRWIAYDSSGRDSKQDGLFLIEPTGTHRHRVVRGDISGYGWSRDGRRLAVAAGSPNVLTLVGVDGRAPRRLSLQHAPHMMTNLTWSPDDRFIAFDGFVDDNRQDVWTLGADGHRLRHVTSVGANHVVGWSRLAPVQPPATPLLPSERITGARTVATRRPITGLSADGARVAFTPAWTGADCGHPVVWMPGARTLERFAAPKPCGYEDGVADVFLAGSRVAWVDLDGCGNNCYFGLSTATLAQRRPQKLSDDSSEGGYDFDYHLRGKGDLLVFNDGAWLGRVGADGTVSKIRSGAHACCADSASAGLIAIREVDAVTILDEQGRLLRVFPFAEREVTSARLDGGRLVVARSDALDTYDLTSGALVGERSLPKAYRLDDVDAGVAVLRRKDNAIMLLRLDDGRSFTLAPGTAPRLADLEPNGLYYSYTTPEGEGRVVFLPRDQVVQRLGAAS